MVMGSWSEKGAVFFLIYVNLLGFLLGFLGVWDFLGFCSFFLGKFLEATRWNGI